MSEATTTAALRDVTAGYESAPVIRNLTMSVDQGDLLALVGPNGGGKSTLLKLFAGLLLPQEGKVEIHGLPPRRARGRIGYLPQSTPLDLDFPVTVWDLAAMGRLRATWRPQWLRSADQKAVGEALGLVDLADLAMRPLAALSTGQRQRALLARALATEPDLLLLDEPEAGIDAESVARLHELLSSLRGGVTIVVASHDVDGIASMATRGATVDHGLTPWQQSADLIDSTERRPDQTEWERSRQPYSSSAGGGAI